MLVLLVGDAAVWVLIPRGMSNSLVKEGSRDLRRYSGFRPEGGKLKFSFGLSIGDAVIRVINVKLESSSDSSADLLLGEVADSSGKTILLLFSPTDDKNSQDRDNVPEG